ncbi:MAG: phenylalanine--tRNA ligase subunit beta [Gammaproteobacteria bacterium]|nr:phenylalanine--tRNA ligase subunit beta [Gammaproteobacteria bacterium]
MKIAESWLREWVNPDLDTESLAHQLTMLGHEVDGIEFEGAGIDDIVVAEVVSVVRHPDADKLSLCKVSDGSGDIVDVVCGAPNVTQGMKAAFARPGVTLPNGLKLRTAKIRGITSNGMLCSALELGLGDESNGIMVLPQDAEPGSSLVKLLDLPDAIFDLNLTPNRGDCFSVLGVARDVSALTGAEIKDATAAAVDATIRDSQAVELVEPAGCPRFAGRVVRGINREAQSPAWMTERLRRAGLRAISPVVDITNYVMLELGQPLHAYDHSLINGTIRPRLAKKGEKLTLLDEKIVDLNPDTLVITDDSGPIGMAGIMGGLTTAVSDATSDVFFEAAFWPQDFIAGRARAYGMHTDASMRFERGVDPAGQSRAVERATQLLLDIAGGKAGPLLDQVSDKHLPIRSPIALRKNRLRKLLGLEIADDIVVRILTGLGMQVELSDHAWMVLAPSHRFDISIEADLIEEVARIHGYESIPETTAYAQIPLATVTETKVDIEKVASTLIARDFQEVVTYSFIDEAVNAAFSGSDSQLKLSNPISSEMSVMRASLWPGMVAAASSNNARQQDRVRLFEISKSFHGSLDTHTEVLRIAGLASGTRCPEQWGVSSEAVDFFDIKADVEAVLALSSCSDACRFVAARHPALQPGQSAEIIRDHEVIGIVGKLHPKLAKLFDLKRPVYVFELDAIKTLATQAPAAVSVSKFPAIRRDIAVIVDDGISADELVSAVAATSPKLIQSVKIFDIYRGPGIEAGRKSVAMGLILQETSRTLTDDDADSVMGAAVKKLKDQFAAVLRD